MKRLNIEVEFDPEQTAARKPVAVSIRPLSIVSVLHARSWGWVGDLRNSLYVFNSIGGILSASKRAFRRWVLLMYRFANQSYRHIDIMTLGACPEKNRWDSFPTCPCIALMGQKESKYLTRADLGAIDKKWFQNPI